MKALTSSSSKNQPLSAPLPTRTQERLDREAAYEQTKQEGDKWSSTMRRIQEVLYLCSMILTQRANNFFFVAQAEHLSFPLQTPEVVRPSNLELTSKFKVSLTSSGLNG